MKSCVRRGIGDVRWWWEVGGGERSEAVVEPGRVLHFSYEYLSLSIFLTLRFYFGRFIVQTKHYIIIVLVFMLLY